MKRRSFLKVAGGVAGVGVAGAYWPGVVEAEPVVDRNAGMPMRVLGRTGEKVSVVGFPGLALRNYEQDECNKTILRAYERGVNYYDVAPAYGRNGICEVKMGLGMQGMPRDKMFLACKTKRRNAEGAEQELERSLRRLRTDHFDLYQLHALFTEDEVKQALAPGGAMDVILKAKEQGKIRYIGFSAHTTKAAVAVMKGFKFDTAMFPINFVEYFHFGFGKEVLAIAKEQGTAVLAIKPLSMGAWEKDEKRQRQWWYKCTETQEDANLAMRWTLSQNNVVAGIPPSWFDLLDRAIVAARGYEPIKDPEIKKLAAVAKKSKSVFLPQQERAQLDGDFDPVYAQCGCPYSAGAHA